MRRTNLEHDAIVWAENYLPITYRNYERALTLGDTKRAHRLTKRMKTKYKETGQ